jgi:hypothetical protein
MTTERAAALTDTASAGVEADPDLALVQFGGLPIFLRPDGLKAVRWLGS